MANFNFLNNAQVFIVYNNLRYNLDVSSDIKFSQTFTDNTYPQKTLHEPKKLFEASNIKKANPADFAFSLPMYEEDDLQVIFDLLVDYKSATEFTLKTFDLYIELPDLLYKIQKCAITNGTFIIEKLQNLKLQVSGQGARLSHYVVGSNDYHSLGLHNLSVAARSAQVTPQRVDHLSVTLNNTALDKIYKISAELQNDIEWNEEQTIHKALQSGITYPTDFTLKSRILSGTIGQYVATDSLSYLQSNLSQVPLVITAGKNSTTGFQFNLQNCTFTNRNNVDRVFTQNYDWRMNDNPDDLGTKLKLNSN